MASSFFDDPHSERGFPVVGTGFTQQQMTDASILSHTRGDNSQLAAIIEAALLATRPQSQS